MASSRWVCNCLQVNLLFRSRVACDGIALVGDIENEDGDSGSLDEESNSYPAAAAAGDNDEWRVRVE